MNKQRALAPAGLAGVGDSVPAAHLSRMQTARLAVLAIVLAACSASGLSADEWIWCKEHPAAVDAAAGSLKLATAQQSFKEPTWWQDYMTTALSHNNAALVANPDFIASCSAAQAKAGVDQNNVAWCMADGIGETWDAADAAGLMTDVSADTYAYRALPLQQRITDAVFDRACETAYSTR